MKRLPLAEDSEEFQRTIQGFYDTLAELHGKLWIVKVAGCLHPLQWRGQPLQGAGPILKPWWQSRALSGLRLGGGVSARSRGGICGVLRSRKP